MNRINYLVVTLTFFSLMAFAHNPEGTFHLKRLGKSVGSAEYMGKKEAYAGEVFDLKRFIPKVPPIFEITLFDYKNDPSAPQGKEETVKVKGGGSEEVRQCHLRDHQYLECLPFATRHLVLAGCKMTIAEQDSATLEGGKLAY